MFSVIDHDKKNNIYCWYDYKGVPSRWVELAGRHADRYDGYEAHVLKRAAGIGIFDDYPEIKEQAKEGYVPNHWLRHLFPVGMGGNLYGKGFSNISLMPRGLAENYYRYLRNWYYGNLLIPKKQIAADGHKIFFNVPILPAVVTMQDVPFLVPLNNVAEVERHDNLSVRGHDVLVAMRQWQNAHSNVPHSRQFLCLNELTECIYPPQSLIGQIRGDRPIAGGPRKPELVMTKGRQLVPYEGKKRIHD